jgi:hypothetical protein
MLNQRIRDYEERRNVEKRIRLQGRRERERKQEFPSPPIPGKMHIVPIRTLEELKREAEVMNNCVGSYRKN